MEPALEHKEPEEEFPDESEGEESGGEPDESEGDESGGEDEFDDYSDDDDDDQDDQDVFSVKWCFPLVRSALLAAGMAENTRFAGSLDWDLRWGHSSDIPYDSLRPTQLVNHFRFCQRELGSKAQFARNARAAGGDVWAAFPRAHALDDARAWRAFCADYLATGAMAVVKTARRGKHSRRRLSTAITVCERHLRALGNARAEPLQWTADEWVAVLGQEAPPAWGESPGGLPAGPADIPPPPPETESEWETESEDENDENEPPPPPYSELPVEAPQDDEEPLEGILAAAAETLAALGRAHAQLHMDGERNVWVVKPGNQGRGEGVQLAATPAAVLRAAQAVEVTGKSRNGAAVVQKYIERPLLHEGRKLDIRFWVAVTSFAPLELFYFDAYVRFAHAPFSLDALEDRVAHVVNRSVQIQSPAFDELSCYWTSGDYRRHLAATQGSAAAWDEAILPRALQAIVRVLRAGRGRVVQRDNSFEWLGFDVAVDDALRPWVIEANTTPDHSSTAPGDAFDRLNAPAIADLLDLVTDARRRADAGAPVEASLAPADPEDYGVAQRWRLAHWEGR